MGVLSFKRGTKSRGMLAGYDPGVFIPIATITVGSTAQSSVTFTSIPSTYTHLQIRGIGRFSGNDSYGSMQFNSVTPGANYYNHRLLGNGSAAVAQSTADSPARLQMTNNGSTANNFAVFIIDILDYTSTNKNKTVRYFSAWDNNGSGLLFFDSSLWSSTPAAITSIKFDARVDGGTSDFGQYTQFALYGIKGA